MQDRPSSVRITKYIRRLTPAAERVDRLLSNELIKVNNNGKTTARALYDFLDLAKGQFARWANQHILNNQFAEEGFDFERFDINVEGNETIDFYLSIDFAKKLCMVSKSERGEQARNYFIEIEKQFKNQLHKPMSQLEILAQAAQALVEQEQKLIALESRTEKVETSLTIVKDTIVQRDDNWRGSTNIMLNRAVKHSNKSYQEMRSESYQILEERAGCDLNARLRNMRRRFENAGVTKSKISALTKMDVIEDDKRLKEIYTMIVKELVIKYVA